MTLTYEKPLPFGKMKPTGIKPDPNEPTIRIKATLHPGGAYSGTHVYWEGPVSSLMKMQSKVGRYVAEKVAATGKSFRHGFFEGEIINC